MTHRAQSILETIATLVDAATASGVQVFTHRAESLDEAKELPAVSVDYGDLELLDEGSDTAYWQLDCPITAKVAADTEAEARAQVLAIMADIQQGVASVTAPGLPIRVTLGLAYVQHAQVRGWSAPEVSVDGQSVLAALTAVLRVMYSSSLTNPES